MSKALQRDVEIDGQRCFSPNGQTPPTGWPVTSKVSSGAEHPRPGAELVLALAVVEPRVAARAEQEQMVAGADREGLGDPPGLDAERLRRSVDRRRGLLDLDQAKVGRVVREPGAGPIRGSFADQVERDIALGRVAAVLEQEDALPGAEHQPSVLDRDRELGRRQRRAKCAGMSSGPSSSCS